ncbi:MAG: hypothetical protein WEB60_06615, partial [Terrimicrobiaceae bacterium]
DDQLAWSEGMEEWAPLSVFLSEEVSVEGIEGATVILEGPGYLLSPSLFQVGAEVFPMMALLRAEVEVEHTKRGKFIIGSIITGVLTLLTLAMPLRPETTNHWILWSISLVVLLFFFIRSLLGAFKETPAFVAVHLTNGDDRILPMSPRQAKAAAAAINETIRAAKEPTEEEE